MKEERKHFFSLIPRVAKKRAWASWRNNPPTVTPHSEEDKTKAFLMSKLIENWWKKEGGHKKVWNKIKNF